MQSLLFLLTAALLTATTTLDTPNYPLHGAAALEKRSGATIREFDSAPCSGNPVDAFFINNNQCMDLPNIYWLLNDTHTLK